MVTQRQRRTSSGRVLEPVPQWWTLAGGSQPEYYVYKALLRTGRKLNVDFTYQSKQFGGRLERLQREQYEANGIKIAFIDEDEAFENADYYVRRALSGYTSTPLGD